MLATTVKAEDGTQRSGLDIFFLTDAKVRGCLVQFLGQFPEL